MSYEKTGKRLIIIGVSFIAFFGFEFIFNTNKLNNGPIDSSIWGQFGDIIGGFVGTLVSIAGVLLIFETLKAQRDTYIKQQVETRFFELLKLHRENVAEMQSKGKEGRNIFIDIKDEFHSLYDLVKIHYPFERSINSRPIWEKKTVQISYFILYFGVDNSSTEYLSKRIKQMISTENAYNDFLTNCFNFLIENHRISKEENQRVPIKEKTYLVYDGHQSRLGHYFRHLFQTVNYINDLPSDLFSYREKYNYIKTLRAQLGTHEQAILLYDSISPLGEPWELSAVINDANSKLITKYNLIKNIPFGFTGQIDPKKYYPNIYYEFDEKPTSQRVELEKVYNNQITKK